MSSSEDGLEPEIGKKREALRACDGCRRKKVKCDGPSNGKAKKVCSECKSSSSNCTYMKKAPKRGPSKKYVDKLERRLDNMESLFRRHCPDVDIERELGSRPQDVLSFFDPSQIPSHLKSVAPAVPLIPHIVHTAARPGDSHVPTTSQTNEPESALASDSDDDPRSGPNFLSNWLKSAQLNPSALRFFGKASGLSLVRSTFQVKGEQTGNTQPLAYLKHLGKRRDDYWLMNPWEARDLQAYSHPLDTQKFEFPEADLMPVLVDNYFAEINIYSGLLHRPTFEAEVASELHLRDRHFARMLLTVCALGSHYCDDPRVFLEGVSSKQSSGWKWFRQVNIMGHSPWATPSLYCLQLYSLLARYLLGTSGRQACWLIIGAGIRVAQDIGLHRRKIYSTVLTPREELYKRAFWALIYTERSLSWFFGRSCALQDEDFDIDLPVECDDEFWEGEPSFQQPKDRPSKLSFACHMLRLYQILGVVLRSIYCINKSKLEMGLSGPQREVEVIAHLDSAMNKWFDAIPDHLRWDPQRKNDLFFNQSATLHATFYALQITVHRPFIRSSRQGSAQAFPSLAICTNAARALSHIVDIQQRRTQKPLPNQMHGSFMAALVLLLALYGSKRTGLHLNREKEMADVQKCMNVLKTLEPRWHPAGKLWDVLAELSTVGAISGAPPSGTKRARREEDSADGFTESPDTSSSATESFPPATQRPDPRYAPDYAVRPIHPSHSNYSRATTASHGHETSSHGPTTIGYQRHISAPVDPVYDGLLADIFTTPQLSSLREGEPSAMLHDAAVYDDLVASLYSPLDTTATLHNPPYPPAEHTSMQNPQRHRHSSQGHERTSEHGVQSVHPTYPASDYAEQRMYPDPGQMGRHPDHAPFSTHSYTASDWSWFMNSMNGYPQYYAQSASQASSRPHGQGYPSMGAHRTAGRSVYVYDPALRPDGYHHLQDKFRSEDRY